MTTEVTEILYFFGFKVVFTFVCICSNDFRQKIKVLCEQTREANKRIKIYFFGLYVYFWEYCVWFSCLEYEEINQQRILV